METCDDRSRLWVGVEPQSNVEAGIGRTKAEAAAAAEEEQARVEEEVAAAAAAALAFGVGTAPFFAVPFDSVGSHTFPYWAIEKAPTPPTIPVSNGPPVPYTRALKMLPSGRRACCAEW